jgi:hypothetical protein
MIFLMQYSLPSEKPRINQVIEDSILDAEKKGAKVIGLGLLKKVLINLIFWHESSIFLLFG